MSLIRKICNCPDGQGLKRHPDCAFITPGCAPAASLSANWLDVGLDPFPRRERIASSSSRPTESGSIFAEPPVRSSSCPPPRPAITQLLSATGPAYPNSDLHRAMWPLWAHDCQAARFGLWAQAALHPGLPGLPGLPPKAGRRKTKLEGTSSVLIQVITDKTQALAAMAQTQARHREVEGWGDPWMTRSIRARFTPWVAEAPGTRSGAAA